MAITCSFLQCEQPLLGTVVMLAPTPGEEIDWGKGYNTYVNQLENGTYLQYVLLHQTCFQLIFDEFMRQELMTSLEMLIGPIALLAEEMQIPR